MFDIDNIVIPTHAAHAVASVQKIEYKEIVTPQWREQQDLTKPTTPVTMEVGESSDEVFSYSLPPKPHILVFNAT
jgi:hypothetical protein